jgi:DNA-binding NarL/FixJ family response regulator
MKQVLLADDHPIFRAGLQQVLDDSGGFEIIAQVSDGTECIAVAKKLKPQIIVSDLTMPGKSGFEIAEWAKDNLPDTKIVIISMHAEAGFVAKAKTCGAVGFVAKEDAGEELMQAICADRSNFYTSSSVGTVNHIARPAGVIKDIKIMLETLTAAETGVLVLISRSKTSPEIAQELGISVRTVQTHRQNLSHKLGIRGANSLLNFAIKYEKDISDVTCQ